MPRHGDALINHETGSLKAAIFPFSETTKRIDTFPTIATLISYLANDASHIKISITFTY